MRCKWWLSLLAFILLTSAIRVSFSAASNQAEGPLPPAPPRVVEKVERNEAVVDGYGPNAAAARERAMSNAQQRVEKLLLQRFGENGWRIAPELLDPDYLERHGVVQEQGQPEPARVPNDDGVVVARYRVELTPSYLTEVKRVAREQLVQDRHLILARVLAGLVVVLLVAAGYLRLEDMTRGYATQLLRMSAFTLLALAAAALWLTV